MSFWLSKLQKNAFFTLLKSQNYTFEYFCDVKILLLVQIGLSKTCNFFAKKDSILAGNLIVVKITLKTLSSEQNLPGPCANFCKIHYLETLFHLHVNKTFLKCSIR